MVCVFKFSIPLMKLEAALQFDLVCLGGARSIALSCCQLKHCAAVWQQENRWAETWRINMHSNLQNTRDFQEGKDLMTVQTLKKWMAQLFSNCISVNRVPSYICYLPLPFLQSMGCQKSDTLATSLLWLESGLDSRVFWTTFIYAFT